MPFDDREDTEFTPNRKIGIKKKNPVSQDNRVKVKEQFEKTANNQIDKIEEYKKQSWDLAVKYKSFIESKVLPDNRGPIASGLEKEVLDKLASLASEMNEDDSQPESIGSTALCVLLLKCMLIQRDTINTISFKLDQLEKKIYSDKQNIKT